MTVRRLENEDEEKFWEAWIKDDLTFCYRYGKIGSAGGTKIKKFKTNAEALAELEEKLKQKLGEGFTELGAEPPEEEEEEEEEEKDEEDEEEAEKEEEDTKDEAESDDDEGDDEGDDESEDESEDESDDEDEESEEDEEESDDDDDEESDDDDEEEAKRSEPPPPPPPPPKPTLPVRVRPREASAKDVDAALVTLTAVAKAVGGRSWRVSHRARAARRALERLGGIDPQSNAKLGPAFSGLMAEVIAPKKRLSLDVALGLLWEVDAAAVARTVTGWRAKMLSSPASTSIGVLAATFDAVTDPEVAVHAGVALVERHLPAPAWKQRFGKVLPFLEEALGAKGSDVGAFLAKLQADSDPIVKARIATATTVHKAAAKKNGNA